MNTGWRKNYLRYREYFLDIAAKYKERADLRAYLEIFLSLITVSIFSIFALRPTLLTIASLIKEIETKNQTLEKMQTKIENLSKAQTLFDRERSKINILFTSIPDQPYPDVYARQIEGLSKKYGLEIIKITAGEAIILGKDSKEVDKDVNSQDLKAPASNFKELPVSANYLAKVNQTLSLLNTISDFEKLRRPVKINSIKIKTLALEENTKMLELSIEATLPYFINN